ncbi:uncharacterized protein [Nicotiana sylvestris]|uniref:uncharacterized protein n=1 Tax=Nicotiana sylvestris TaxID=4096 RepID=UPI00388C8F29
MAEDSELWDVICDRPFVPTKTVGGPAVTIPKTRKEFNDADRKTLEKNFRAKKILVFSIGPDEYNRILVKQSKIDMLTTEYELFRMKDDESIQDMHTRFTSIINEIHSLGKIIPRNKLLTIDELVDNLKTYKKKKKKEEEEEEEQKEQEEKEKEQKEKEQKEKEKKEEKDNDSSGEDADIAYLTKRFQKMVCRNRGIPKRGSSSKPKAKRNPVPDKRLKRKNAAENVVKQALAACGDSSSESEKDDDQGNSSMMAMENKAAEKQLRVWRKKEDALARKISNVEHERDDLVVVVVDLKETIKCVKKEKEVLIERVANIEHERDDLLVVVVDLKETIEEHKMDNRPGNRQKGKEVASEAHLKLENE